MEQNNSNNLLKFNQNLTEPEEYLQKRLMKNLCPEAPVQLLYNGHEAATLLCTPNELTELAVGWLYSQGLIEKQEEIHTMGICDDRSQVFVRTNCDRWFDKKGWQKALTSGCGGGAMLVSALRKAIIPISHRLAITREEIKRNLKNMINKGEMYRAIGGIHSSALANDVEGIVHLSEDIGRHNAVDKVIGKGIINNIDLSKYYLLTTGRISAEIVLKAARAGISNIASLSVASSLALEIAFIAGISLIGRGLNKSPVVYTHPTD